MAKADYIYAPSKRGALRQGEMITGLVQARLTIAAVGADPKKVKWSGIEHPFAIILSQDCDLAQDWRARRRASAADPNARKRLLSNILFAQVHEAAEVKVDIGVSDIWKRVRQNKDERYHFLQAVEAKGDRLGCGLPELSIDFKHYFTLPTDEVYKRILKSAQRRCRLVSPYMEHLSTRFCYYQFRVALPQDHLST